MQSSPCHLPIALTASSWFSNTTIPVPLGVPSGPIATSARTMFPASRNKSLRSCQVASGGSCAGDTVTKLTCQYSRYTRIITSNNDSVTHTTDEKLPEIRGSLVESWSSTEATTSGGSTSIPTSRDIRSSLTHSSTNLSRNGSCSEPRGEFSILECGIVPGVTASAVLSCQMDSLL